MVILVVGFLLFYTASRTNWSYVTAYDETAHFPSSVMYPFPFGLAQDYPISPHGTILMQSNDVLSVSLFPTSPPPLLDPFLRAIYVVLFEGNRIISYGMGGLGFANNSTNSIAVSIHLAENGTGTIPVGITLNHYEAPNWFWFGLGVAAISGAAALAIVSTRPYVQLCDVPDVERGEALVDRRRQESFKR
jgi:hypothetical protein